MGEQSASAPPSSRSPNGEPAGGVDWPAPAAPAPGLPPIAAKADDLEAIKKAVDDAAAVGGGLWLSYLFVLFYLAVAAGAVTHQDLFFEHAVKLPFLGIELPLVAFFALAPLIFLIVHAYTLVHLVMLTNKAKRYHQALYDQMGDQEGLSSAERAERKAKRDGLRRQLPSNIFIQFLAGPSDLREGGFGWLLRAIAWITLVVAPVLLILMMQIQFLPYHSLAVVWTQRVALAADLVLIWWLWRRIMSGREDDGRGPMAPLVAFEIALLLSFAALLFSCLIATFPGEWQEDLLAQWDQPKWTVTPHNWLFNGDVDNTTRRRASLFSSTLVLPGLNVYEGLGIDDPEKVKWRDYVFRARGRDLKGAIFDLANLPKVDFEGAKLQGASLVRAQLQGAALDKAQLQGASLPFAQLQGASLPFAQLQGASLFDAQLQGASLDGAHLQGAFLDGAQLQGASLLRAQLQGASLDDAQLQGASLGYAQLQGASLVDAQLQGASLFGAQLQGASLGYAQLQGASLVDAQLQGASLDDARLQATDLSGAYLWRTQGNPKSITSVRLADGKDTWRPVWRDPKGDVRPWADNAYGDLQKAIDALPPGAFRHQALERIRALDCADKTLAPCDPASPPAPSAWWSENAQADGASYQTALAAELRTLACSGGEAAVYVVRGGGFRIRLRDAGVEAAKLIDDLANKDGKDCPVSAALTDADRAKLLRIKQEMAPAKELALPGPAYSP